MQLKFTPLLLLPLILGSCFSSAIMQTAKPTPVGTLERSVGLSGYVDNGDIYPAVDGMLRTGLYEKADIGLAYSLGSLGHLRLDFKHQLYTSSDHNWYLSSGFGVDGIWAEEILGPTAKTKDVGLTLPLYFSFNHNEKITPYFAQRATLGLRDVSVLSQYQKAPELEEFNLNHDWYYTGGGGIRWGEKNVRWFAELSYTFQFNRIYVNDPYINQQGVQEVFSRKELRRSGNVQVTLGVFFGR